MKKIIFCDIDGTIVDHPRGMHFVSDKVRYAFSELLKEHLLFLASGRAWALLPQDIRDLPVSGCLLSNGSYAFEGDRVLFDHPIGREPLQAVMDFCRENDAVYYFETHNNVYTNGENHPLHERFNDNWDFARKIYRYEPFVFQEPITAAMIAMETQELVEKATEEFKDYFDSRQHHGFTSLDLNPLGVNKGSGIRELLEKVGIGREDAYAFGDGLNDLEMMTAVGHPIAMGNAFPEIKELCSEVCEDVLDDGFYHALVRHGLIKPINNV